MSLTIKKAAETFEYYFNAKLTPFIWGKHGIGKSQSIREYAKSKGLEFIDIRLGQFEVGDLLGLPTITKTAEGETVTTYAIPEWLLKAKKGNCLILWDEINRARLDVIQAVFQAVLDRKMHTIEFADTTYQMCAGNPDDDESYILTDIKDAAFMSRFGHLAIVPSVKEWTDFAKTNEFADSVIEFVIQVPDMFNAEICKIPVDLKPNARALEFVSRIEKQKPPKDLFMEMTRGIIGMQAASAYFEILDAMEKPISAKELLSNYQKVEDRVKKYSNPEKPRQDLLKVSLENVLKELTNKDFAKVTAKEKKNFVSFIKDLPNDLAYSGMKEICQHEKVGPQWLDFLYTDKDLVDRMYNLHLSVNEKKQADEKAEEKKE